MIARGRPGDTVPIGRLTDEEVMEAIRDGDRDAVQLLVDRYWFRLTTFVERMVGSRDAAEDIAQEVFVRVWKHRARWISGKPPSPYLFQIARNLVMDRSQLSVIRSSKEPEIRTLWRNSRLPIDDAQYGELQRAFDAALRELPPRRREAFLLIRMEGYTLAEAATAMDAARQTVANHVHLAMKDLRAALARFLP